MRSGGTNNWAASFPPDVSARLHTSYALCLPNGPVAAETSHSIRYNTSHSPCSSVLLLFLLLLSALSVPPPLTSQPTLPPCPPSLLPSPQVSSISSVDTLKPSLDLSPPERPSPSVKRGREKKKKGERKGKYHKIESRGGRSKNK